jgi:hypothetical protein
MNMGNFFIKDKINDDELVDFEYMDPDIHLHGKVRKKSLRIMNKILYISLGIIAIGVAMICFSDNDSTMLDLGVFFFLIGTFGEIFLAPYIASYFA